jgi:microcystin-dependent protein
VNTWPKASQFVIKVTVNGTDRPSGYAPLALEFSNLPDHPDGTVELLAEISPLFIDHEEAVGITQPLRLYADETKRASIGFDNGGSELRIQAPNNVRISGTGTANTTLTVTGKLAAPRMSTGVTVADDTLVEDAPAAGNLRVQHKVKAETFETATGFNLEMPKGTILMWSPPPGAGSVTTDEQGNVVASSAPSGWEICAGPPRTVNGVFVPNLSGRFIVGQGHYEERDNSGNLVLARDYSFQNTGGSAAVALSEEELPVQTHGFVDLTFARSEPGLAALEGTVSQTLPIVNSNRSDFRATSTSGSFSVGPSKIGLTSHGGGPDADGHPSGGPAVRHENRPPFFVVVYIIKVL